MLGCLAKRSRTVVEYISTDSESEIDDPTSLVSKNLVPSLDNVEVNKTNSSQVLAGLSEMESLLSTSLSPNTLTEYKVCFH
jgi:hypothetical protein